MIHDIENLTFAELKQQRAEIIAAVKAEPDLAERYHQARMDAKHRDEKLAEQGTTIKALQDGTKAATEKAAGLEAKLHEAQLALKAAKDATEQVRQQIATLSEQLANERQRAERLKTEALRNQSALNGAAKILNDAIAQQRIDNAG